MVPEYKKSESVLGSNGSGDFSHGDRGEKTQAIADELSLPTT